MVSESGKNSRNGRENLTVIEHTRNNNNDYDTLSWCQTSGKNSKNRRENLTVIELTRNNNNNNNNADKFKEEFTGLAVIELR